MERQTLTSKQKKHIIIISIVSKLYLKKKLNGESKLLTPKPTQSKWGEVPNGLTTTKSRTTRGAEQQHKKN
jgi:hypothetical protein